MVERIVRYIRQRLFRQDGMDPRRAYNCWSSAYDQEGGNVIQYADEQIFNRFLNNLDIEGKMVADIGCGTGRHWANIMVKRPARLIGFDISEGMLKRLQEKFPGAESHLLTTSQLNSIGDHSCDLVLSTLTIGHIRHLASAFGEWDRVLKSTSDIIITDFHPGLLTEGRKRTFQWNNTTVPIECHIYTIEEVKEMAVTMHWQVRDVCEAVVDDTFKPWFEKRGLAERFEKNKGMRLTYGIHLKKENAAA